MLPPTADDLVRRFQTYLSCQALPNLRIFPVAQEKEEDFAGASDAGEGFGKEERHSAF